MSSKKLKLFTVVSNYEWKHGSLAQTTGSRLGRELSISDKMEGKIVWRMPEEC